MARSIAFLALLFVCFATACGNQPPPTPEPSSGAPRSRTLPDSLFVRAVKPGSAADSAGVVETDYLDEFCGVEVRDVEHLAELQRAHKADAEVTWIFLSSNGALVAAGTGRKTVVAPPGPIGVTFR